MLLLVLFAHRLLGWQRPRLELGLIVVGCVIAIVYQIADLSIFHLVNSVGHLQRLLREVVSNALRHSGGSSMRVMVSWSSPVLTIHVDDDGRSFSVDDAQQQA